MLSSRLLTFGRGSYLWTTTTRNSKPGFFFSKQLINFSNQGEQTLGVLFNRCQLTKQAPSFSALRLHRRIPGLRRRCPVKLLFCPHTTQHIQIGRLMEPA